MKRDRSPFFRTLASVAGVLAMLAIGCTASDSDNETDEISAEADANQATWEGTNPRFGVWQLESDAPPPSSNIMTYEPYGDGGMKITVTSTNADGEESEWSYTTMFDGEFYPVTGRENAETAVEVVDERTNRILNRRDGELRQTIINVLSEDGNTINNEYRSTMGDGTERVSHAIYRRIE